MSGGQALRLGPFVGGLNTASDPTAIADAEVVELTNFELDIDGSLISRTPLQEQQGHIDWAERIICIGIGIFGTDHYVIGSNITGVYYYLNNTWTLITNTFQASVAVQYANTVYLVPRPGSGNGGKWDPVGGFTAVAAIPKGQAAVIHKSRLFICAGIDSSTNTSRLSFSDPDNLDSWPAPNFIDVGQGDGTKLIDLTVFQDNLLLFKNQATYVLSYDVRPTDAVVRKISNTIGVSKQYCVVNYENQVYVLHDGWVYEILNYDFNRLNTKVPFVRDETAPSAFSSENLFLSIMDDRLFCRFYKKVYVYGMRTRTWSEWSSASDSLQYFGPIITIRPPTGKQYYAGSCLSANRGVIKFVSIHTSLDREKAFNTAITASDDFNEVVVNSWGTSDQGLAWNNAGTASEYDKTGTEGTQTHTVNNVFHSSALALGIKDVYTRYFIKTTALAAGAGIIWDLIVRDDGVNNFYFVRMTFNTDQTISISLIKRVAGVQTVLTGPIATGLTHVANTKYGVRLKVQGSQIQARAWLASNPEPITWQTVVTDVALVATGDVRIRTLLPVGNTNVLPFIISIDDFEAIDLALTNYDIQCSTKTKNFDMAVSHQFKRLWWWGVDVSTPNEITGTATPVILSFSVTWDTLALPPNTWDNLNTWDQPLTDPQTAVTVIAGLGGLSRRFAKFNKSLRYRQINFRTQMSTDGSTTDGPVRLFTMTIITESKATVPKQVN